MSTIQITRVIGSLLPAFRNAVSARTTPPLSRKCTTTSDLDPVQYEKACSETLESLSEYFEEIVEQVDHLKMSDISYGDGVLTVNFGPTYGSYVINRQTPNKQIWLSSPTSGPKRYDFVGDVETENGKWIYRHTGETLHELLQKEIKEIAKTNVDFFKLPFSKAS
ncbi:frataxin homolog, mitochondrial isoform X2 [Hermetia illucens]|uniref:frataxin homolog, mitochondrial isoform X2 n=1 Tax=Hermetia illucens TaxID=343691 RepID=UPI0018CC08BE|nr:frataxin homolog, mitochondrial isoform X2 [Hermetia illucens]